MTFWACGLGGEAGEVLNQCKKLERDTDPDNVTEENLSLIDEIDYKILMEVGDTLFYLVQVLHKRGMTLRQAAVACLTKLDELRVQ